MSTVLSCIVIVFFQKVLSSQSAIPNTICVAYKSSSYPRDVYPLDGIVGDYTYGGIDYLSNMEYWTKPLGSGCDPQNKDYLYIRYSKNTEKWQITYDLSDLNSYYFECVDDNAYYPFECGNNKIYDTWYNPDKLIDGLNIIVGECETIHTEKYLTVSDYIGGYWQGCNAQFQIVSDKINVYKSIEEYTYNEAGYPDGPVSHYWYYNSRAQGWICNTEEWFLPNDYSNTCLRGYDVSEWTMKFHD